MIRAETGKASLARARDAGSRHMRLPDLGDQEDTVALTGNRAADELLGAVDFRRVDQRHAERDACAQRFLFNGLRMSSLSKTRGPLSQGRDDGAIRKLDRPSCGCADARGRALGECTRWRRKHRAGGKERRRAKRSEEHTSELQSL